jgi:glycosyltransferase involved in cell wall biosynthesis
MAELVRHRENGWLVEGGDFAALAGALSAVFTDQFDRARVRSAARAEFERHYTADRQYDLLMHAYQHAIETKRLQRNSASHEKHASGR